MPARCEPDQKQYPRLLGKSPIEAHTHTPSKQVVNIKLINYLFKNGLRSQVI